VDSTASRRTEVAVRTDLRLLDTLQREGCSFMPAFRLFANAWFCLEPLFWCTCRCASVIDLCEVLDGQMAGWLAG